MVEKKSNIGLASRDFKKRSGVDREAFKDQTKSTIQTYFSRYVWDLKNQGPQPNITWKLIDRGNPFSPVTGFASFVQKRNFISCTYKQEMAELNSRREIVDT